MSIEDMKVGDVLRIASALQGNKTGASSDHGIAIVVLDRGFVYVGKTVTDGDFCTITEARNIRVWGTSKGLGQLALKGPQDKTELDPVGTVKAPMRSVISIISTEDSKWKMK